MTGDVVDTGPGWLPLVWGRTRRADRWWRVRPGSTDPEGWLSDVVAAAFSGGTGLGSPRFLLARVHGYWVTGVACAADALDPTMATDQHGRALFAFVGWMTAYDPVPPLPTLQDWEAHYAQWAGRTYQEWVRPDWDRHRADIGVAADPPPEQVGWVACADPGDDAGAEPLHRVEGRLQLHPHAERFLIWAAAARARTPFVLVSGWADRHSPDPRLLTHATIVGLAEAVQVPVDVGPDLGPGPEPEPADAEPEPVDRSSEPVPDEVVSEASDVDDPAHRRGLFDRLPGAGHRRLDALERAVAALNSELIATRREVAELRARLDARDALRPSHEEGGSEREA